MPPIESEPKIREYIGISCETHLSDDVNFLEVLIPEFQPAVDGKVKPGQALDVRKVKVENQAKRGKSSTEVKLSNTIKCAYLGSGANRTPPNIHIGEQVKVIHYSGSEYFYWCPLGRDDNLRTTERLTFRVANKKKQKDALTEDTSYFVEMDTRKGKRKIRIHTSSGTGEKVEYDLTIDTEKSKVILKDSVGNGLSIDSLLSVVEMHNNAGSSVTMDKTNIVVKSVQSISAISDVVNVTSKIANVTSSTSVNVTTPVVNIVGVINSSGNAEMTGNITVNGNLTVNGNSSVNGNSYAASRSGASI
jgi:hypothetical protein